MSFPDFTIFTVIFLEEEPDWRDNKPSLILRQTQGGMQINVGSEPTGHLFLDLVATRSGKRIEFTFQRVNFSLPTGFILIAGLKDGVPRLSINDYDLKLRDDQAEPVVSIEKTNPAEQVRSFDDPLVEKNCAQAVQARAASLGARKRFVERLAHRDKTENEQLDELSTAAKGIRRDLESIKSGEGEFVPDLAVKMRSLLYFNPNTATYYPLLFILANNKTLPLPVYFMPNRPLNSRAGAEPSGHWNGGPMGITRKVSTQVVGDLADYWGMTVMGEVTGGKQENATVETLVHKLASSAAPGHYGDSVANILDEARRSKAGSYGLDFLGRITFGLAEAVGELCDYVLESYERPSAFSK